MFFSEVHMTSKNNLTINWSAAKITQDNPCGLYGVDFIEYAGPDAKYFENLFTKMGFTEVAKLLNKNIKLKIFF